MTDLSNIPVTLKAFPASFQFVWSRFTALEYSKCNLKVQSKPILTYLCRLWFILHCILRNNCWSLSWTTTRWALLRVAFKMLKKNQVCFVWSSKIPSILCVTSFFILSLLLLEFELPLRDLSSMEDAWLWRSKARWWRFSERLPTKKLKIKTMNLKIKMHKKPPLSFRVIHGLITLSIFSSLKRDNFCCGQIDSLEFAKKFYFTYWIVPFEVF